MSDALPAPEIAVVVLSYGPRATLVPTLKALVDQGIPAEIVVIHSGPGDPSAMLAEAGLDIPVVLSAERLYAGGARNLGVAHTAAPIVAFLSDDQLVAPGWLRGRLDGHADGYLAVASACLPHRPRHPTTLAIHLTMYIKRMPLIPAKFAQRYGLSVTRETLEQYGPYDETLRIGEDTDFKERLPEGSILWAPHVQSAHLGMERAIPGIRDAYQRSRRRTRYLITRGEQPPDPPRMFRRELRTLLKWGPRVMELRQRRVFYLGVPLLVALTAARAAGARAELRANR